MTNIFKAKFAIPFKTITFCVIVNITADGQRIIGDQESKITKGKQYFESGATGGRKATRGFPKFSINSRYFKCEPVTGTSVVIREGPNQ